MDRLHVQHDELPSTPPVAMTMPATAPTGAQSSLAAPDTVLAEIARNPTSGLAPNSQAPTLRHMMQGEH